MLSSKNLETRGDGFPSKLRNVRSVPFATKITAFFANFLDGTFLLVSGWRLLAFIASPNKLKPD